MTKFTKHDQENLQNVDMTTEQTHSPGRRRLIQGASAAPILLVSGRSALACNPDTEKCALSPIAWISAHPKKGQAAITVSHAVGCNSLGQNPDTWKATVNLRNSPYRNTYLPFYSTRTIRAILNSTNSLDLRLKYFCAAHLNALTNPTYALTTAEVGTLYAGTLGGRTTDWSETKLFLEQTWQ